MTTQTSVVARRFNLKQNTINSKNISRRSPEGLLGHLDVGRAPPKPSDHLQVEDTGDTKRQGVCDHIERDVEEQHFGLGRRAVRDRD